MRTKIVYDVISTSEDNYFEQAWASAWSLKYYTQGAYIIILTDIATKRTIYSDARKKSLEIFDEVITVNFEKEYSNKEKSRWIKTNMRRLVEGDFLFIDSDTIVCGDLTEIDNIKLNAIGAVLDNHCYSQEISSFPIFQNMYIKPMKEVFNIDYDYKNNMYNSGVLLVKDTPQSFTFFDSWHRNWEKSREKGECRDQLALLVTMQSFPNVIQELEGIYNCQIRNSIQYFIKSKIIHTFVSQENSSLSVIFGSEIYDNIKRNGGITPQVVDLLLGCKYSFNSPSFLMDKHWLSIRYNPAFIIINQLKDTSHPFRKMCLLYLNFTARVIGWGLRHLGK